MTKTPIENTERDVIELKARVAQLEHALLQNEEPIQHLFGLPSTLADLFGLLLTKPVVTAKLAQYEMNVVANCQVSVHRLRLRLTPLGIKIHTRRKVGWYLDDETKERIRLWIAHHPTGDSNGEQEGTGTGTGTGTRRGRRRQQEQRPEEGSNGSADRRSSKTRGGSKADSEASSEANSEANGEEEKESSDSAWGVDGYNVETGGG